MDLNDAFMYIKDIIYQYKFSLILSSIIDKLFALILRNVCRIILGSFERYIVNCRL